MFGLAKRLKEAGVLGINHRNAVYLLPYNERRNYPLVDDKVLTKDLAIKAGAAVPDLYGLVEIQQQVAGAPDIVKDVEDFVVKPAQGSQGEGIIVVTGRSAGMYRLANGTLMDDNELRFHVSNILSGIYSLGGQSDKAIFEYRVKFDPVFEKIAYRGVPDVRIIVFLGVPVMAMVRLPTRMSGGKANLHQGAIGAGIDIPTGQTLTAVWKNAVVSEHPDTLNPVSGVQIPNWDKLLDIAARSYEMTDLGYQGIDLVLDADRGPLILELNARPGLNIQIANREGLAHRLEAVVANRDALKEVDDRIAFAKENFGSVLL
ncbi:MAG: alpha-L-glutamate ligase-like protein [Alphaproteobacteria bacterium]